MLTKKEKEISKSISYHLRHKPVELGIELDKDGYAQLDKFLFKLSNKVLTELTIADIQYYLNNSEKKRFEIDIENNRIRAKYGHSVDIDNTYDELLVPVPLYHGTPRSNIESILKNGLKKMSRNYVHVTSDINLAISTALRYADDYVIIEIDTQEYLKDGNKIYFAGGDIYLMDKVNSNYLKIINQLP